MVGTQNLLTQAEYTEAFVQQIAKVPRPLVFDPTLLINYRPFIAQYRSIKCPEMQPTLAPAPHNMRSEPVSGVALGVQELNAIADV